MSFDPTDQPYGARHVIDLVARSYDELVQGAADDVREAALKLHPGQVLEVHRHSEAEHPVGPVFTMRAI